jgi:uncharacterized protein (TIGR04141 family)
MLLSLNALLLRQTATPASAWTEAVLPDVSLSLWTNGQLEPVAPDETDILDAAMPGDVIVSILRRFRGMPPWQEFLKELLNIESFGVASAESLGAAIFCAISPENADSTNMRWIAWTFGSASRSIRRSAVDPRFGLLATLNLMALSLPGPTEGPEASTQHGKAQLREIRYRTNAPYVQQTGHRAARDIPLDGFRVDRSSDLVATVGGTGADPALSTSTILGGRSLRFRAAVNKITDLVDLAGIAINRSRSADYRQVFGWIDNVRPVEDVDLESELRTQLASELVSNPNLPSIDTILPDDLIEVGDDRSIRYIVFPRERGTGQGRTTLALSSIAAFLSKSGDPVVALDAELRFLDESKERIGTATVLECLSGNLRLNGSDFIAYDGVFYQVNHKFIEQLNIELERIPESTLTFPPYHGETEPAYNSKVGRGYSREFIELDRALITFPGESGVEASDLVAANGALIHIKRKGKSSTLSHLFLQAANSCELLRREPEAWDQVRKMMQQRAHNADIARSAAEAQIKGEQSREGVEVTFGFLGDWRGKSTANLPLFSRISLVNETRRIRNLGFQVTTALISIE